MPQLPCSNFSKITDTIPTLLSVPAGIGCSIGGYAGDAIPSARLLAAASGCLITHPNVMNGGSLYWRDPRIQYVEGYAMDRFAVGDFLLRPVRQQKVGLLLDAGLESELRQRHLQVADGCRATLGLSIGPVITTTVPLEIRLHNGSSGASWGYLENVDVLLRAGERLKQSGATSIAVVTRFPDQLNSESLEQYRKGQGVDDFAGAEAVISHLLVKNLSIPCAHAPAMYPLPIDFDLDPRAAGEEIGYTFLPSVLVGLSQAPDLVRRMDADDCPGSNSSSLLKVEQLGAVVVPEGALGSETVLACLERRVPLIVVLNPGVLEVTTEAFGLNEDAQEKMGLQVLHARNYPEAAGYLLALREGIAIDSLQRPLQGISEVN